MTMKYALTLMTHPSTPLPDTIIDKMDEALNAGGYNLEGIDILSENLALDGFFEADNAPSANDAFIAEAFQGMAVDYAIIPVATRRKSLLIADMDSTIIMSESLDDLARMSGKGDEVAEITARSMRGELDFGGSLIERVKMISGNPASLIQDIIDDAKTNEGAEALVATAIGLAAAIPANWFFNKFTSEAASIEQKLFNFGKEVINLVERSL